ncbi:MAG: hypothetical protein K2L48_02970 [Mycoplasmoidaceae bacterium]|nr:hypothetical protein [Mycoplasmoidaceae bacterium]
MKKLSVKQSAIIKNVCYFAYVFLLIAFAIIGIFDQIFGFLLMATNPIGIGTLSIFTFLAILFLCLFILFKIVILIKHKVEEPTKKTEKK